VTSTHLEGTVTVVETEPAALTDAIRQGEIDLAQPLSENDVARPSAAQSNGLAPQALGQSFRSRGQAVVKGVDVTTEVEVVANAEFAFDLKLDIKLSVVTKWRFGPPEVYVDHFKTALNLKTGPTVEISAKGTVTGSKNVTLPGFKLRPIVVNIGPVPITFTPQLANTLKLQASATAAASSLRAGLDIAATLGVEYRHSGGWKPISSVNVNRRLDPFSPAAAALDAKASIQSTFTVYVWETVGPAITGTPHARVHIANSDWGVYAGFLATAGVHFKVPVIDRRIAGYDVSLFKQEWLLAGATGPPPTTTSTTSTSTTTPVPSSKVAAWGYNGSGQLGDGTTTYEALTPVEVHGLTGVTAVAARGGTSLALRRDGTVWAWGANSDGALGNGSTDDASAPVQVRGLTGATAIDTGGLFSMALRGDGTVWAWGFNGDGELGNGTTTDALTPVQVRGLTGVTAIAAGGRYSMALRSDGTVWAWGRNPAGQLGNGTTTNAATPVQVRGLTGVVAIAAGYSHSLAVRGDGTIWAWGENGDGELGNASTTNSLTPVQVRGLTGVATIAAGAVHSLAVRGDGTVWAWGHNHFGQLGTGTRNDASTPVQVPGLTGVTAIAAGASHSLALRDDGTVWAWGDNGLGALGTGTRTDAFTPVQVPGPTGVTAIAAGDAYSLAVHP
jgi:alpha-tubulin suppressor-like RCC1 family protein